MSDNLTPVQIVNLFCNMSGVLMNEAQREYLANLFQTIYESKEDKCDGCQHDSLDLQPSDISHLGGEGTYCHHCRDLYDRDTIVCHGCSTLVPESDTELQTYPTMKGLGVYCSGCRKLGRAKCDGCKTAGHELKPLVLTVFSAKVGNYCTFCIRSHKEAL